ncbi:MAG: ABC transporter ATP-binding protein [Kineosporiaceae bacterium]
MSDGSAVAVTSEPTGTSTIPAQTQNTQNNVAEVKDLHVTFTRAGKQLHALRGVSLDIKQGEILGLVGESGSGKSVLGLTLLGLHNRPGTPGPRIEGQATVRGLDMVTATQAQQREMRKDHLGAVFQDPMTSLDPTMKIGRQVTEAAGSEAEALRLLTAVGIPEPKRRMGSYPHELSGGLRQRVMIAMAVAGKPSLVIADEPTTALDVTVQAQVLTLLKRLRDEIGCAVVMITHDLGVAAQVADRIAVMYAGRLAEVGPANDVLANAAHPYSLGLLRSRLSLHTAKDRPLLALPGEVPSPLAPLPGCAFATRCTLVHDECRTGTVDPREVLPGHLSACTLDPEPVRTRLALLPADHAPVAEADPADLEADAVPVTEIVDVTDDATTATNEQATTISDESGTAPDAPGAPNAEPPAVAARGLTRTFAIKNGFAGRKKLQALRGVDLTVARGESVALVGESGSGKSTLLRLIAGLDAGQGEVRLGSKAGAQMVFQDAGASLTPWLTVGELVGERLRSRKLPTAEVADRVAHALQAVGLPAEVAAARSDQLSGGQRQRVALARATIVPPEILLCDEPTSALDVSLAAGVLNLIARLRADLDMAVLFVTHDLSVARIVADRIAVMYLGRIVEIGTADEVTHRPRHPYTQALVAAIPDVGVAPPALTGEPASPLNPPTGCSYHPRCPFADADCAQPTLDPRLARASGDSTRLVACVKADVRADGGVAPGLVTIPVQERS